MQARKSCVFLNVFLLSKSCQLGMYSVVYLLVDQGIRCDNRQKESVIEEVDFFAIYVNYLNFGVTQFSLLIIVFLSRICLTFVS